MRGKSMAFRGLAGGLVLALLAGAAGCSLAGRGEEAPLCLPMADLDGELYGVWCGQGADSFRMPVPEGWRPDWENARRLGVGAMFLRGGTNFDDAPAILYPRVYRAESGGQDEAARSEAEKTARAMQSDNPRGGPRLRGPCSHVTADGTAFTLFFFDDGPAPNESEASAFLLRKGLLLELVLSARTAGARAAALPRLYEALESVRASGEEGGPTL